jgi:hypothetical protein
MEAIWSVQLPVEKRHAVADVQGLELQIGGQEVEERGSPELRLGKVTEFFDLYGEVTVSRLNADGGVEGGEGLIEPGAGEQDAGDLGGFVLIEDLEAGVFLAGGVGHALGVEDEQDALPVTISDSREIEEGPGKAGSGLDMKR